MPFTLIVLVSKKQIVRVAVYWRQRQAKHLESRNCFAKWKAYMSITVFHAQYFLFLNIEAFERQSVRLVSGRHEARQPSDCGLVWYLYLAFHFPSSFLRRYPDDGKSVELVESQWWIMGDLKHPVIRFQCIGEPRSFSTILKRTLWMDYWCWNQWSDWALSSNLFSRSLRRFRNSSETVHLQYNFLKRQLQLV